MTRTRRLLPVIGAATACAALVAAAGAPISIVVMVQVTVAGMLALLVTWLGQDKTVDRIRLWSLAAGMGGSLLAGCYGWHPLLCVVAGAAAMLVTAAVLDDRARRRR